MATARSAAQGLDSAQLAAIDSVQDLLGIIDVRTTVVYTHVLNRGALEFGVRRTVCGAQASAQEAACLTNVAADKHFSVARFARNY